MSIASVLSLAATAPDISAGNADLKVWAYAGFIALVLVFLALDLGVFHRDSHEVSMREAMIWSVVWVTCGVSFAGIVYKAYDAHWLGLGLETARYNSHEMAGAVADQPLIVHGTVTGADAAKQYLVGYVVEKSLAMDNIFVIAIIFAFFAIPAKYQHRVLFWGIIGALAMRGAMIGIGAGVILRYQWVLIIFGGFLILTALKMALLKSHSDPGKNPLVRLVKRFYPVYPGFDGQRFTTRIDGVRHVTPLLLALVLVEVTDVVFAVDSIPAIFAVTPDPFIVFTSNIFAILGLRSLYFCLAAMIAKFRYLKPALILILAFVGVKLLLLSVPPYLGVLGLESGKSIKIDTTASLLVVVGTLVTAAALSIVRPAAAPERSLS